MKLRIAVLMVVVLVAGACGDSRSSDPEAPHPAEQTLPEGSPTFAPARVLIDTEEGSVIIDAEKAETEEQLSYGLMNRESLDQDAGMIFLFFEPRTCCFHMENTPIPLSIAFFDEEGIIVAIEDMEPCVDGQECELYSSDTPYTGALEVNQGAFERLGVQVGDRITVTH
ncbi:MAG: DUF192 domain-containing protein [Actinomycetota bacterium]